jgi:3-hydroxyisobutyrate dehydrogenase-like beta-hydroxyacid dehydrogenase
MARRIERAGFELHVWARRGATLEPFRGSRAQVAASPRALGAACELVCICVVTDADVEQVLLGDTGVLAGMRPGGLIAIHSTVHPELPVRIAERARDHGVDVLDAPVSGGGEKALAGELKVMVGGSTGDLERARPVFESHADQVVHVGPLGAGQVCKLLNNALLSAQLKLGADAQALAARLGLDPGALLRVAAASSGSSFALELLQRMPLFGEGEAARAARAAMANLVKDQRILGELLAARGADGADLARVAAAAARLLGR